MLTWSLAGLALAALPLTGAALAAAAVYGGYYGAIEVSGSRGLPPPGRRWQVPQTMLIDAPPARRVLVWGAILGPGFLTRNPYAGFGLLPLALAAARGAGGGDMWSGLVLGAMVGLAHGSARAIALLRDVAALGAPQPAGHLDLLLKTIYWRRLDGAMLIAAAATSALAAARFFS